MQRDYAINSPQFRLELSIYNRSEIVKDVSILLAKFQLGKEQLRSSVIQYKIFSCDLGISSPAVPCLLHGLPARPSPP